MFARHDYDEQVLAVWAKPIEQSVPYSLIVRATGGAFSLEFDGSAVIQIDDPLPHLLGHVGIRTSNADLHIDGLQTTLDGDQRTSGDRDAVIGSHDRHASCKMP